MQKMRNGNSYVQHRKKTYFLIRGHTNFVFYQVRRLFDYFLALLAVAPKLFVLLFLLIAFSKVAIAENTNLNNLFPRAGETFFLKRKVQQEQIIRGQIVDAGGSAIVGASIRLKSDSSKVTNSDAEGLFSLSVPVQEAILLISYVGYKAREVAISNKSIPLKIVLESSDTEVEEVVVVGYGTARKGLVTGSVAQIKGGELKKSPVSDLTNALVGRLPGLRAIQRSGQPGADASAIDIRGFGPALVIIDDVPGSFSQLDPSEIETISIIKDATAAIYGVRAANGVVLVTTKFGEPGKPRINYSNYFGLQTINRFPELGDAALYAELSNEAVLNAWAITDRKSSLTFPFSQEQIEKYKDGSLPSYNWFDKAIKRTSGQYYHNLNVSGSGEDVRYFMNVGMINQAGMWRSDATNFKRYNVRTRVEARVANGLTAQINLMGNKGIIDNPSTGTSLLMAGLYRTYPTYPFYANDNPDYLGVNNNMSQHTLALTDPELTGYNKQQNTAFNGILSLRYQVPSVTGLTAKVLYSYNYGTNNNKAYSKRYNLYRYDAEKDEYTTAFTGNVPSNLSVRNANVESRTFQGSLNYERSFADKHNVGAMMLFESQEGLGDNLAAYRQFFLDGVDELFAGGPANQSNSGSSYETARLGYVGRLKYNYDGKYIAEAAFRYDGTYKVMSGQRYGFFPSVSLGWMLSKEQFLKDVNAISQLKLRVSHGKVGDDEAIAAFQYLMGYTYPSTNWFFGETPILGLKDRGLTNEMLTWYTSKTTNMGLDFSLWNGLISGEVDVFYRKRVGLMATRWMSLPNSFGATMPQENLNTDSHRGFEVLLRYQKNVGEFRYSISPNVSWSKKRFGYIEQADFTNSTENWRRNNRNRWANVYWGFKSDGQFQNQEEINTAVVHDGQANKTILPGDIKYVDLNGDGIIDAQDQTLIGRGDMPELFYGLNLGFGYKGFDFSVLFQGASNFNAYFSDELQSPLFNNASAYAMFGDRWRRSDPTNADSPWIAGKYPSTVASGSVNNKRVSDFWLKDASYLRLKNFEFGYSFNLALLERAKVKRLRLYASGQNILTIDKVKFIDPEAPWGRGDYYPQQRVWTAGLNIGF